jgi:hypothetical protein
MLKLVAVPALRSGVNLAMLRIAFGQVLSLIDIMDSL